MGTIIILPTFNHGVKFVAKGISQDQVSHAADQLLYAGERPTIERIRGLLGTGSPNTVNRFLDIWWQSLGSRLSAQTVKIAIPGAPKEVLQLATQLWETAVLAAEDRLSNEKSILNQEHILAMQALKEREDEFKEQIASLASAKEMFEMALTAANQQVASLNQLIEKNTAYIIEIKTQRDDYKQELQDSHVKLNLLRSDIDDKSSKWEFERKEIESVHQASQDRWILEVDRARQEEVISNSKIQQITKQFEQEKKTASSQIDDLKAKLLLLESTSQAKAAQIDTLVGEINRLHEQLNLVLTKTRTNKSSDTNEVISLVSDIKPDHKGPKKRTSRVTKKDDIEIIKLRANQVFDNAKKAQNWLESSRAELHGKSPLEVCRSKKGRQEVLRMLGRIDHGIFA